MARLIANYRVGAWEAGHINDITLVSYRFTNQWKFNVRGPSV